MNELTVRSGFNTKWVCHKFVRVNQFSEFWDLWIVEKGFGNCCLSGALSLSSVVVVQSLSRVWIFVTWWTVAFQASLSFTISLHLLKLMSIESVMPSNHFILYHPFLLLPLIFPSTRVFSNELALCPCSPRDSQESSPTPQFKSINSLAISFLHSPTLTSIHDHWKNHSLD